MLGAVVTTSSMAVGSRCAWAEAHVGAVLTQPDSAPGPNVSVAIRQRVSGTIRKGLSTDVAGRLRVRVYHLRSRLKG